MQALSQLSYGPGTRRIDGRLQSLRVANHISVVGKCGFIRLQPHKIKMKFQSILQFGKKEFPKPRLNFTY